MPKIRRRGIVAAAAAVVIAGAGISTTAVANAAPATGSAAATTGASTPASTALRGPVYLSNSNNGQTVDLKTGQTVLVYLTGSTALSWSEPTIAPSQKGAAPVLVRWGGGTLPDGDAWGFFQATHDGTVTINSTQACRQVRPGQVCPLLLLEWHVTVDVGGAATPQ